MAPDQDTNVIDKAEDLDEMILVQRKRKNKAKNSPPDSYVSFGLVFLSFDYSF